jgi:antitoxin CptB
MPDLDLDARRRRAIYRASHRGTRELDIVIGGYARAMVPEMDEATLTRFEAFLLRPEPELQRALLAPEGPAADAADSDLIAALRSHHGLR